MGLLSVLMAWSMMLVYLAVIIYLIWLLSRLVHAVETIAKKIEGSSKI
jgi:flagellar biogenesis protein FliO